ncbi:MAG: DUF4276 family protein [Paludibacterium sp.]|uniref:DUF4276 family protein n=1 Tax=Paludibacterium sp. TaxID=1917523 RepID=UPI0025D87A96|nr:DUF4276 family protein [Paludibacterium sp.]MBV8046542.1 DUF4276 family protein [Paludibacterium sp.]
MTAVVTVVEGDGEVQALPILLRRLTEWYAPGEYINIPTPIRVRKDRFINKEDEFKKHLLLAAAKCNVEEGDWVLILLDADDDCPVVLADQIKNRASAYIPYVHVSVVIAKREYEAWFIAAAPSLNGARGFIYDGIQMDAEEPRNAKGWMSEHMPGKSYKEIMDQPALSAAMDLQQAFDGSRSFRKLCKEWKNQFLVR